MLKHIIYLPSVSIILVIIRMMCLGSTVSDALALIPLSLLCGFLVYLEHKKEPPINESIKNELSELKTRVEGIGNSLKVTKAFGKM